jgi:phytoene dehydrogenase-like protein
MPAADLLDEWFESDAVKGAIAANGVRDVTWGPMEAGTAYTLLHKWGLSNTGLFRSIGQIKGGMGALTQALVRAVERNGGQIRLGAEVEEICIEGGRAVGVRLASGEVIPATAVVSGAGARTTFLDLLDPAILDAAFVRHVLNIKHRGSTARLHLALSELPAFTALGGREPRVLLGGPIQISPSIAYLQRAFDCTKYGAFSERPYLDLRIPTLSDPGLAPPDRHVMSVTVKYAPYHLRPAAVNGGERPSPAELWAAQREEQVETVLDTLAEYAPDIREKLVGFKLLTPVDLETGYGLPEGNLNHGEMTLDQFFHMRPIPGWADYRTPVAGLFLCGSGSHPGGGITGLPGRNAARVMMRPGRS